MSQSTNKQRTSNMRMIRLEVHTKPRKNDEFASHPMLVGNHQNGDPCVEVEKEFQVSISAHVERDSNAEIKCCAQIEKVLNFLNDGTVRDRRDFPIHFKKGEGLDETATFTSYQTSHNANSTPRLEEDRVVSVSFHFKTNFIKKANKDQNCAFLLFQLIIDEIPTRELCLPVRVFTNRKIKAKEQKGIYPNFTVEDKPDGKTSLRHHDTQKWKKIEPLSKTDPGPSTSLSSSSAEPGRPLSSSHDISHSFQMGRSVSTSNSIHDVPLTSKPVTLSINTPVMKSPFGVQPHFTPTVNQSNNQSPFPLSQHQSIVGPQPQNNNQVSDSLSANPLSQSIYQTPAMITNSHSQTLGSIPSFHSVSSSLPNFNPSQMINPNTVPLNGFRSSDPTARPLPFHPPAGFGSPAVGNTTLNHSFQNNNQNTAFNSLNASCVPNDDETVVDPEFKNIATGSPFFPTPTAHQDRNPSIKDDLGNTGHQQNGNIDNEDHQLDESVDTFQNNGHDDIIFNCSSGWSPSRLFDGR